MPQKIAFKPDFRRYPGRDDSIKFIDSIRARWHNLTFVREKYWGKPGYKVRVLGGKETIFFSYLTKEIEKFLDEQNEWAGRKPRPQYIEYEEVT